MQTLHDSLLENFSMQTTYSTLRSGLNLLILRHSLPETLDRLLTAVDEQSTLEKSNQLTFPWDELILHLEKVTEAAIALAQLKEAQQEDLWR